MQRHACSTKLLAPMVNFNLKKNIIFLIFHGHKNTQFSNLFYFGKLQILVCYMQLLFKATKQCISIWTIVIIIWRCNIYYSRKQTMWQKKPYTNKIVGVAIESPTYSNTTICMAIEGPSIASKY